MSFSGIYTTNDNFTIQDQWLRVNYVTAASGSVGTSTTNLTSIAPSHPRRQLVLITNTSGNDLYVGFISTMTAVGSWSYKLATTTSQAIQVGANVSVYVLGSASSTTFTYLQGV